MHMRAVISLLLMCLAASVLNGGVLAAVRFSDEELHERSARDGLKEILAAAREAYFQNHNHVDASWRVSSLVPNSKLNGIASPYLAVTDFSLAFPADKPGWVRIECRDPFPNRNGPLVLEANLAGKEEIWTEPGPDWGRVGRAAIILFVGMCLAWVVPLQLRRRLIRLRKPRSEMRLAVQVTCIFWWPIVAGITWLALSDPAKTVFGDERPYQYALVPLLLLLGAYAASQAFSFLLLRRQWGKPVEATLDSGHA